jgi:hypothetical protein
MFPKPPPPPPLSAQFQSTFAPPQATAHLPAAGLPAPPSTGWSLFRSSDGKTRIDQGTQSLISNPQAGHTIRLDHAKQEAQVIPMTTTPGMPTPPSVSAPSSPLKAPTIIKDLGTRMIAGHQVQGMSYTYPALKAPGAPSMPRTPGVPQPPSAPQVPGMPPAQTLPQPHVLEVWTSPKLQLPLASRVTGGMGTQTTISQQITPGEPPASHFRIPPNYKILPPPKPLTAST